MPANIIPGKSDPAKASQFLKEKLFIF